MFVLFYTVNLYICVFMTCSTLCCLYDTLKDSWNVCMLFKLDESVCIYCIVFTVIMSPLSLLYMTDD